MTINDAEEMKKYITSILSHGFRLQNIEMEENLGIMFFVSDVSTGETHHAYLGFEEFEAQTKINVKKSVESDSGGIIISGN